jgi:hypothetical protein
MVELDAPLISLRAEILFDVFMNNYPAEPSESPKLAGMDSDKIQPLAPFGESQKILEHPKDLRIVDLDESETDLGLLAAFQRAIHERKLVRKLDMRLLPTIVAIYVMNYIDVRQYALCKCLVH